MGIPESSATTEARGLTPEATTADDPTVVADDPSVARNERATERDHVAEFRDNAGQDRDALAEQRDHDSDRRDLAAKQRDADAERRDELADLRDHEADDLEAFSLRAGSMTGSLTPARESRRVAASHRSLSQRDRADAAIDRDQADLDRDDSAGDRAASSGERTRAGSDRAQSLADRGAAAETQRAASIDCLTGVYLRGPGLLELERDIARSTRAGTPFTIAFLDVDHLKEVNDAGGHAAGDRLLLRVSDTLKAKLRPYDLIIRFGGDEFICGLSGLTVAEAAERMALVQDALGEAPEHGSLTIGIAELRPDDSLRSLIERADTALYRLRYQRNHPPNTRAGS